MLEYGGGWRCMDNMQLLIIKKGEETSDKYNVTIIHFIMDVESEYLYK